MSLEKAFHIVLTGSVQGVGFRYYARQKALELGLKGWVRNKTDGSVEIEVEGNETAILVFQDLLKAGNRFSRVDRIFKTELSEYTPHSSFFIRH